MAGRFGPVHCEKSCALGTKLLIFVLIFSFITSRIMTWFQNLCGGHADKTLKTGGEAAMVTDEIQKVTELEEEVKSQKEAVAVQNKQRVAQAQRTARLAVEQARQQAETEAGAMMTQAETQAQAWTQSVLEQARKDCEALKAQMRSRLDEAAAFLIKKVVS